MLFFYFFVLGENQESVLQEICVAFKCRSSQRVLNESCTLPGCSRSAGVSAGCVPSLECLMNSVPKESCATFTRPHLPICFLSLLLLCTHTPNTDRNGHRALIRVFPALLINVITRYCSCLDDWWLAEITDSFLINLRGHFRDVSSSTSIGCCEVHGCVC